MKKYFRIFLKKEKVGWFRESDTDIYRKYGLVREISDYIYSLPTRKRCYALYRKELLERLKKIPSYPYLVKLAEIASKLNMKLYIVGGAVRDLILKNFIYKEPDLLVEGDLVSFMKEVEKEGFSIKEQTPFLTMKLQMGYHTFDITLCRKELYEKPGSLPKVLPAFLIEDLYRRDFTINAMAFGLSCEEAGLLYDPFYGLEDLERGFIRVIKPYSFIEDPTRIIRGIRLKVRFSFDFDEETRKLITLAINKGALFSIGWVRFWKEIEEVFKEEKAVDIIFLMDEFGIWQSVDISLGDLERKVLNKIARECLSSEEQKEFLLYTIFGLQDINKSKEWGLRFQLSKDIRESLSLIPSWKSLKYLSFTEKYKLMKKVRKGVVKFWSLCFDENVVPLWEKFIEAKPIFSEEEIKEIASNMGSTYDRIKMEILKLQIEEGLRSQKDILERLRKESA